MPAWLAELARDYGRPGRLGLVPSAAGNTACGIWGQIIRRGWPYCAQIKSEQGDRYQEAARVLGPRRRARAAASDGENGPPGTDNRWCYDLEDAGGRDWTHARQRRRVARLAAASATAERPGGNRDYGVSLVPGDGGPTAAWSPTRAHWRCALETHGTAEAARAADRRRLAWSRHPDGVLAVMAIRMRALAILAVARRRSRRGDPRETPTWHQVAAHFLLTLGASVLETAAFDDA